MASYELKNLHYLWDGTENWVLHAFYYSQVDLKIVFEGARPTIYLPFNQINQTALIIEDEELLKRVTKKMLEAGVPVTGHTEVD